MKSEALTAPLNHPRLLSKRDELAWPALHRFLVSAACARKVGGWRNDFFYMAVGVIPKLDTKREIIVTAGHS
jgi:hypothetical protein